MHVVATAGHVDHGKSTLVRALTGTDPDRLAEERRRGLTIDLGFVWTTPADGEPLAFVDVPGHQRYLATALAGVATAPTVLLVVAADEGWMPQSQEHLQAIDAFGVRSGLLVVTRADLADPAPALAAARERLAGTSLEGVGALAVSARTGAGLDALRGRLAALAAAHPAADPDAPVRLWLDRSFSVAGAGTVVTGTLTAGRLTVGDTLDLAPHGRPAAVRGLQCLGRRVDAVTAPARVAVNLRRVAHTDVRRGDALVTPGGWWRTGLVDVRLTRPLPDGQRLPAEPLVHCGTAVTSARLRRLGPEAARLRLRTPLDLHLGDRLLLRDPGSRLLAGAVVLDVEPPELTRRGAGAERGRRLAAMPAGPDALAVLRDVGLARVDTLRARGVEVPEGGPPGAVVVGDWLLDPDHARRLRRELAAEVAAYARDHPTDPGLPLGVARQRLDLPDAGLVAGLVAGPGSAPAGEALTVEELAVEGGLLYRRAEADRLPPAVAEALARLRSALRATPFRAPSRPQLAAWGLTGQTLALLVRRGELERYGEVHLPAGAAERALARLRAIPRPFTVGEACRALGTSRRVAIPLLEALDRAGATRRDAAGRRTVAGGEGDAAPTR
ncbi:selenocysteine-specific translation elongation factor [Streptomyces sp. 4N509B]|uniref:selenocysteine-specific translation elongation factor n=1 Tax=Streptomyces sp. 4N509B TaxID=3457413 RepID=UPI003FD2D132